MYLKSIRVQGFKTFARRTELPFSRGITAIVGPNGSGKSNLVDAGPDLEELARTAGLSASATREACGGTGWRT